MSLRVTLLGTGVGIPQKDRSQSSLLIRARDPLLLDCGAGTLLRLSEAGVDVLDLDAVFLTHLHLDHVADLLPLANARYLMGAGPMEIYGPKGTDIWFETMHSAYPYLAQLEAVVHELSPGDKASAKGFQIHTAEASHSVTSLSYRIESDSRAVTYSGDTEPSQEVADLARGSDLLIHECSFPEPYEITNHSTPVKLGKTLEDVGRIILTHLYPEARGHEGEMVRDLKANLKTNMPVELGNDLQSITL